MSRKTIALGDVLERANFILGNENFNDEQKDGVCHLIESLLHSTGNYNGYKYNEPGVFNQSRHYFASNEIIEDFERAELARKRGAGFRGIGV